MELQYIFEKKIEFSEFSVLSSLRYIHIKTKILNFLNFLVFLNYNKPKQNYFFLNFLFFLKYNIYIYILKKKKTEFSEFSHFFIKIFTYKDTSSEFSEFMVFWITINQKK